MKAQRMLPQARPQSVMVGGAWMNSPNYQPPPTLPDFHDARDD